LVDVALDLVKPDVLAPGDGRVSEEEYFENQLFAVNANPVGPVGPRSRHGRFLSIDASNLNGPYTRIWGTSQATAIVSGLLALVLEAAGKIGFDWGANRATSMAELVRQAARKPMRASAVDAGYGLLYLPVMLETLESFHPQEEAGTRVFQPPQLRLLD
jgi:hypothetical protein